MGQILEYITLMLDNKSKTTNLYFTVTEYKEFKQNKISSFAEIWECKKTGAKSLHSLKRFFPTDIITNIGIKDYVEKPNYLSVQIDEAQHIMLKPEFLQYINHSCDPNIFFDTKNLEIICLKKIEIGEAMTFFYPSTEWSMTQSFDCLCSSQQCLGKIEGAAFLSTDILTNYQLNDNIKSKLEYKKS